jgi:hypothetical protein
MWQVEGCEPIFMDGVCCPVKYICGKFSSALLKHLEYYLKSFYFINFVSTAW